MPPSHRRLLICADGRSGGARRWTNGKNGAHKSYQHLAQFHSCWQEVTNALHKLSLSAPARTPSPPFPKKTGALRRGPPLHGSRSYREIIIPNASCHMGSREVTRRQDWFFLQENERPRSYEKINQHPNLPWNFVTHGFLHPSAFPEEHFTTKSCGYLPDRKDQGSVNRSFQGALEDSWQSTGYIQALRRFESKV